MIALKYYKYSSSESLFRWIVGKMGYYYLYFMNIQNIKNTINKTEDNLNFIQLLIVYIDKDYLFF